MRRARTVSVLAGIVWAVAIIANSPVICWANQPQDVLPFEKKPIPAEFSKFSGRVYRVIEQFQQGTLSAAIPQRPDLQEDVKVDSIRVVFELEGKATPIDSANMAQLGGRVEVIAENLIQTWLSLANLPVFNEMEDVRRIRFPYRPELLEVISEGVGVVGADICKNSGLTGSGVKVAILDGGFKGYQSLLGTELPSSITIRSFRSDHDIEAGTEHGTACAEIVHDIVPDAQIYLVNLGTDAEFYAAVNYIVGQGIDVVNFSVGWTNIGPHDGTSTISQKVYWAISQGVIWCGAAGNDGNKHWWGHFYDPDIDSVLNYTTYDEYNNITLYAGQRVKIYLNWEDWPETSIDFDLYLYNESFVMVGYSGDWQMGSDPPTEFIYYEAPAYGVYYIKIRHWWGSTTPRIHLYATLELEHTLSSYSVTIPGDARGSLTAGAVRYTSPSIIEEFSSQGPTWDERIKPDLVAPNGVSTASYAPYPFYGTSASSPHTAGVAALIRSAHPAWSVDQVVDSLKGWTIDKGSPGPDNVFGWGLLQAHCYSNQSPVIAGPTSISVDEGETVTFNITASDPDGDPVTVTSLNAPANSSLSKLYYNTWRFTFSPNYTQAGVYTVSFIASDGDLTDTLVTVITVENRNLAPTITGPTSLSLNEGETTSANLGASDPDGDVVSVIVANPPSNSTLTKIGSSTWKFEFSPDYTQAGTYSVIIIASDGSLVDTLTLAIDVSNVNRAPSIMGTASSTVKEGETTTINLAVDDPDGDALTVSAINMPDNCTILKKSSSLWECAFSPDYDQAGSYTVNFVVTDGSESDTLVWHVTVQNVNRAPQITTVNDLSGPEATTFSMTISATDFDDDLISLTAGELPENATFNDNGDGSGEFVFQPDYTQSGVYTITITASDGDLSTDVSFSVTVTNVNRPPAAFDLASPPPNALLRSTSAELIWQASSDPDPDESVAYWVYVNGDLPAATTDSIFADHDTNTTISDLEEQTTCRWRVVARDTSGGATENTGSWRQFSIDDLTPPDLFFGMIPNSVLPFAVDFVIKPSEELKSYATADVSIGDTATPLTFDHKIESSDGDLYSTKYNFTADGAGRIILRGRDHSNNETVDTVDFSGYRVNPSAPLYGLSYDGLLAIRNSRRMGAGLALVMGYCPNIVTPFERVGWEETTAPYRFVTSERTVRGRVEVQYLSGTLGDVDQNANIILFQLMRNGWMPLPTWRSSVTGDVVGYADSMGTFLAAVGPPDADLQAGMMPRKHILYQNVPNPFNAATTISFEIAESTHSQEQLVTLVVYNVLGQKVKTLMREALPPGTHSIRWDTADDSNQPMPSGVYFARLLVGSESTTIKMVLMK